MSCRRGAIARITWSPFISLNSSLANCAQERETLKRVEYEEGESEEREEKEGGHLIPSENAKAGLPQLTRAAPSLFSGPC